MSGDSIHTTVIKVVVQENGIIRDPNTGEFLGRLADGVPYHWICQAKELQDGLEQDKDTESTD
jgi:hypothetical protein